MRPLRDTHPGPRGEVQLLREVIVRGGRVLAAPLAARQRRHAIRARAAQLLDG